MPWGTAYYVVYRGNDKDNADMQKYGESRNEPATLLYSVYYRWIFIVK